MGALKIGRNVIGALGLGVVAEGVETRARWQAAVALGCDHTQGFWLGHPQNAVKITALLARGLVQSVPDAQPPVFQSVGGRA